MYVIGSLRSVFKETLSIDAKQKRVEQLPLKGNLRFGGEYATLT